MQQVDLDGVKGRVTEHSGGLALALISVVIDYKSWWLCSLNKIYLIVRYNQSYRLNNRAFPFLFLGMVHRNAKMRLCLTTFC